MRATAGGRRRDDVRLALHVGLDVCFIPLRNAYSERCVWVRRREFLSVRQGLRITAEAQRAQRKTRTLTRRTQRKITANQRLPGIALRDGPAQSQHYAPADTFQLAV